MPPWSTDEIVAAARRSGWLPDADDVETSDYLAWGDEEMRTGVGGLLKRGREERGVRKTDTAIVSGTVRYRLPRRALGRVVRGITFVDASGNEAPADEVSPLEAWRYGGTEPGRYYYFEDDELVLPVTPTSTAGYLRFRYLQRPSRLIALADAMLIERPVTTLTLEMSSATSPATITTVDSLVDIVRGDSPFPTIYEDRLVDGLGLGVLTFDATTPIVVADIADSNSPGNRADYVCPRDCTVYPPLPEELHPALSISICARALEARGDAEGAAAARASASRAAAGARSILEPRNMDRRSPLVWKSSALRAGRWR